MKEMPDLICGKAAVGGNYNSTRDNRELVEEITENPYFQYFIGLPGYQTESPFVPSLLVEFRKRLTDGSLVVSLSTPEESVDFYMPIQTMIEHQIEVEV